MSFCTIMDKFELFKYHWPDKLVKLLPWFRQLLLLTMRWTKSIPVPIIQRCVPIENMILWTLHFHDGFVAWIPLLAPLTILLLLFDFLVLVLVKTICAEYLVTFIAFNDVALRQTLTYFTFQVFHLWKPFQCRLGYLFDTQLDRSLDATNC